MFTTVRSISTAAATPVGCRGTKIPIGARIFALADTLDAITKRARPAPNRKAQSFDARAESDLYAARGPSFDPTVVEVFLEGSQ